MGKDAWAVRRFFEAGIEFVVAQSFSKNFGLYGQRVGALHVVSSPSGVETKGEGGGGGGGDVLSTLCHLVRGEYSMAPRGGAEIVRTVLADAELREKWVEDLGEMSRRILKMREALFQELVGLRTPGDWGHILRQVSLGLDLGLLILFVCWNHCGDLLICTVRLVCSLMWVYRRIKSSPFEKDIISIC